MPVTLAPHEVRQLRQLFERRARALANFEPMPFTLAELGQLFAVSRSTAYRVGARLSHQDVDDEPDEVGDGRAPQQPTRGAMRSRAYRARVGAGCRDVGERGRVLR